MRIRHLFAKKTSFFSHFFMPIFNLYLTLPYLSPKYPKELKWERQAISRKSKKCNDVNSSRPDSHPHPEVLIHPFYACYVQHINNSSLLVSEVY